MSEGHHVVVVGGGLGAHRFVSALRRGGFGGRVTVVGDEVHLPYDRPPLSKQVLGGTMPPEDLFYDVAGLAAEWRLGSPAVGLDPFSHKMTLGDGSTLDYDRLVIATGRAARVVPEVSGRPGFHVIRSLDHSLALRDALPGIRRAVVVGAGFVGCEVAATLRERGVSRVTMVDIAEGPMAVLGGVISRWCGDYHRARGVELRMRTGVAEYLIQDGRAAGVRLDSGETLEADAVVLALGSTPNTEWLEGSGIGLSRGNVVCDDRLFAVGVPDVLAIGDVAEIPGRGIAPAMCVEHWTNAREMAELAAHNLLSSAQQQRSFVAVPTFWTKQYDLNIKSAGFLGLAESFEVVEQEPDKLAVVVEARRGEQVVGAVTINKNRQMISYLKRFAETAPHLAVEVQSVHSS